MDLNYIEWFKSLPKELATLLIAMIPIGELRASIPIALNVYHLSIFSSFTWSVIGNCLAVSLVLWLLPPLSSFLSKHFKIFNRFFSWLFNRTRRKRSKKFARWGALALITFVAIPLPFTGGWTGALAAFVFGVPFKKAFPIVALGVLIAGIIVTLITLGASFSFDALR
jgi:uncharacterized membrane protein